MPALAHRPCAAHLLVHGPVQWSRKGTSDSGLRLEQHTGFPFEPMHRLDIALRHKLDNEPMSVQGMAVTIDVSILPLPDLRKNTGHVRRRVISASRPIRSHRDSQCNDTTKHKRCDTSCCMKLRLTLGDAPLNQSGYVSAHRPEDRHRRCVAHPLQALRGVRRFRRQQAACTHQMLELRLGMQREMCTMQEVQSVVTMTAALDRQADEAAQPWSRASNSEATHPS
jgi:hypothetical protein